MRDFEQDEYERALYAWYLERVKAAEGRTMILRVTPAQLADLWRGYSDFWAASWLGHESPGEFESFVAWMAHFAAPHIGLKA